MHLSKILVIPTNNLTWFILLSSIEIKRHYVQNFALVVPLEF